MPNPGTINAKGGKWRIYTARRGFRPQWEDFGPEWVTRQMRKDCIHGADDVRGVLRDEWIRGIEAGEYESVKVDMRRVSDKPESAWQGIVKQWAGWVNTLQMSLQIRFTQKAKAA